MNRLITFVLVLIFPAIVQGQNLVQNGSAEIIDNCSFTLSMTWIAEGWYPPTNGTSDLYHRCAIDTMVGVPNNNFGFQLPNSGDGYFGMYAINYIDTSDMFDTLSWYEYVQSPLREPLEKDEAYCVSFYVSSSISKEPEQINRITDQFGVLFTEDSIRDYSIHGRLNFMPQITSNVGEPISADGWTFVENMFVAEGGERFITLGQFFDLKNLTKTIVNDPDTFLDNGFIQIEAAYYFVDDVCVKKMNNGLCEPCSFKQPLLEIPNVFTPDQSQNQNYRVNTRDIGKFEINIFNRWGDLVYSSHDQYFEWDGTFKGRELSAGVYFAIINATGLNGQKLEEKTTITLIR